MTWKMNDKEFEAVLALPDERRYAYFIKRVAGWRVLWGLASGDNWALGADNQGNKLVPVWPHPRFAAACVNGDWAGYEPCSIDISVWLEEWTPDLVRDGKLVAVFATPSGKGVGVGPEDLKAHLEDELSIYEWPDLPS